LSFISSNIATFTYDDEQKFNLGTPDMNIEQIEKIIFNGESHILELKKSTAQLRSACETACAFLNGDGGIVLFGVTDDHRIIGQEISDKTKREIGNELARITPTPDIEVMYLQLAKKDKYIIVFQVTTDSTKRPYMYDGRAYIRLQSDTLAMSREYLHHLTVINNNAHNPWEDHTQNKVSINELDTVEVLSTLHEGIFNGRIPESYTTENPEIALLRLGLIKDSKITNAAVILFGKHPELIFSQCLLRLARFRGIDKTEFIDNRQVSGNIFKLIKDAMAFANTYLPIASSFSKQSIERIDTPFFPILALREAIANAVCHRDYSYHGGSVSFAIFDNRIEIWSYGSFPPGVSIDNLTELNQSVPRNRRIANVLYYHKIFESWGRGIQMIMNECKNAGHPDPFYRHESGGILLTLPSRQLIGTTLQQLPSIGIPSSENLSERQKEIIFLLKEYKALSPEKLRQLLKQELSERTLRDELNRLKNLGFINVRGQTRRREWYVVS